MFKRALFALLRSECFLRWFYNLLRQYFYGRLWVHAAGATPNNSVLEAERTKHCIAGIILRFTMFEMNCARRF